MTAGTILLCFALVLGLLVWVTYRDDQAWDRFAEQHHCVVVKRTKGEMLSAKPFIYEPERTTYKCDDGVEYTR